MSGYQNNVVSENGEQFIPASQRPDGTWRKARRVKDGYVPQEEVPLYESKGKQFLSKKQEPLTLPSGKIAQRPIPGLYIVEDDTEKKQVKKKNKKKIIEVTTQLENITIKEPSKQKENKSNKCDENKVNSSELQEQTEPTKKLKNLKKRLREIEALEEKLKNGLVPKPEPEQLAKIKRKNDLLMQIHELEKQIEFHLLFQEKQILEYPLILTSSTPTPSDLFLRGHLKRQNMYQSQSTFFVFEYTTSTRTPSIDFIFIFASILTHFWID